MKKTNVIFLSLIIFAGIFLVTSGRAKDNDQKKSTNPFENKIVTIYMEGSAEGAGIVMENAEFKEVNGQIVITGIGADTGDDENWTMGLTVGIPWDSVGMYCVMDKEEFEIVKENFPDL